MRDHASYAAMQKAQNLLSEGVQRTSKNFFSSHVTRRPHIATKDDHDTSGGGAIPFAPSFSHIFRAYHSLPLLLSWLQVPALLLHLLVEDHLHLPLGPK